MRSLNSPSLYKIIYTTNLCALIIGSLLISAPSPAGPPPPANPTPKPTQTGGQPAMPQGAPAPNPYPKAEDYGYTEVRNAGSGISSLADKINDALSKLPAESQDQETKSAIDDLGTKKTDLEAAKMSFDAAKATLNTSIDSLAKSQTGPDKDSAKAKVVQDTGAFLQQQKAFQKAVQSLTGVIKKAQDTYAKKMHPEPPKPDIARMILVGAVALLLGGGAGFGAKMVIDKRSPAKKPDAADTTSFTEPAGSETETVQANISPAFPASAGVIYDTIRCQNVRADISYIKNTKIDYKNIDDIISKLYKIWMRVYKDEPGLNLIVSRSYSTIKQYRDAVPEGRWKGRDTKFVADSLKDLEKEVDEFIRTARVEKNLPTVTPQVQPVKPQETAQPNISNTGSIPPTNNDVPLPPDTDKERIHELETLAENRFNEVKELRAEVEKLTRELSEEKESKQIPTLSPEVEDLKTRLRTAEETYSQEKAKLSLEIEGLNQRLRTAEENYSIEQHKYGEAKITIQKLSGDLTTRQSELDGLKSVGVLRTHLEGRQDLPESVQIFTRELLTLWDKAHEGVNGDKAFLVTEGLRLADSYVYSAPTAYGRLVQEKNGENLRVEDMLRLIALQKEVHEALQRQGITTITPQQGEHFDATKHDADEADVTWVQDQSLHNTVAAVKRLGYQDGSKVLRRAQVKRRLFGNPATADIPDDVNIPDHVTTRQGFEEAKIQAEAELYKQQIINQDLQRTLSDFKEKMSLLQAQAASNAAMSNDRSADQARIVQLTRTIDTLQNRIDSQINELNLAKAEAQSATATAEELSEKLTRLLDGRSMVPDTASRLPVATEAPTAFTTEFDPSTAFTGAPPASPFDTGIITHPSPLQKPDTEATSGSPETNPTHRATPVKQVAPTDPQEQDPVVLPISPNDDDLLRGAY